MQAGQGLSWGTNFAGELGDGTTQDHYAPDAVTMPTGVTFAEIVAGANHQAGLTTTGEVYAWGSNNLGQLGDGTTTDRWTPVQVSFPTGTTVTQLAAGTLHTLALTSAGEIYGWGVNWGGQLGDDTDIDRDTPVPAVLPEGVTVSAIGSGWEHCLAVTSTGDVLAWGSNEWGALGDGTFTTRYVPTQIQLPTGVSATAVAAGYDHSVAITSTGGLLSWGDNYSGQLGDGTLTSRYIPGAVALPSGVTVTDVMAGGWYCVALTSDGGALSWGFNWFGQLGDGTQDDRSAPGEVLLPTGTVLTGVGGRGVTTLATTSTGIGLVWGANSYGTVGDDTTTDRYTPTEILLPSDTTVATMDGHWTHSAGVTGPPPA